MKNMIDLYAYDIGVDYFNHSDKLKRVADRLRNKSNISVRTVNMKDFKNEVGIIREVYNDAWSRNWGFVPMTEEEFEHLGKDLKQIVDPRVVLMDEKMSKAGDARRGSVVLAGRELVRYLRK